MSKVSNALPLTIPLDIPAYWTPERNHPLKAAGVTGFVCTRGAGVKTTVCWSSVS